MAISETKANQYDETFNILYMQWSNNWQNKVM